MKIKVNISYRINFNTRIYSYKVIGNINKEIDNKVNNNIINRVSNK